MRNIKFTFAVVLSVFGVGLWLSGEIAYAQFTITSTSSPVFYIDSGVSPQLKAMYVSYKICNTSGTNYPDIWVTVSNFTGGVVSLAPYEDGIVHIGPINAGQCKTAFFYLQASGPTTTPQSHTVSVFAGPPPGTALASATFSFTSVEETIQASANKVNTVIISTNDPILGTLIIITVQGESGTIGAARVMSYTPAAYTTWRADCFMLYTTTITLSGGNTGTFTDQLLIPPSSLPNPANTNYTAMYTFRVADTCTLPTTVSPVAYISSGTQVKHTATGNFGDLPPVNPVSNNLVILNKTATPDTLPGTGGTVTYSITFANGAADDVTLDDIRDTLPTTPAIPTYVSGSSLWDGSPVPDPVVSSNILTWYGFFTIPAGSTATLTYQVSFPAINCVSYHNSAVGHIGSTQIDTTLDTTDDAPAQETVNVGTNCQDLAITKTHTGNFIVGQQGTYTITVTNVGGASTTGTITVTDTLPTGLSYVSATGPGWSCSAMGQTVTCTNPGPLAPGDSSTITVTVDVLIEAYPSVDNVATVSTPGDTNEANNYTSDTTTVDAPDLAISKTHMGDFTVGQNGTYTITVTNVGTAPTTGTITVVDTLPTGLSFVSGTGTGWSCSAMGQTVTCTNTGPLAPGDSSEITLIVSVGPEAVPSVTNSVTVSTPNDPSPNNNSDDDPTNVTPAIDLVVTKADAPDPVTVGENLTYTITVTNSGPNTATGVTVSDTLPSGVTFVSATPSQGTCNPPAGGIVTCNLGSLSNGASATVAIVVTPTAVGTLDNTVAVAANEFDPNTNNNQDSESTTVITLPPDLTISKSHIGDFIVGTTGTYTITVTNIGTGSTTETITVTDTLPAGLGFISGTGAGWTCSAVGQTVTCTNPGPLAPNESSSINLTVSVGPEAVPSVINSVTVSTPNDSDPNNNSDDDPTNVLAADLTIEKTHTGDFAVGTTGVYTITVTNVGTGPTTGTITVTDTLPTGLSFVSGTGANWTCFALGQTVTCTNPGPLAPSASSTITLTVNVESSAYPSVTNSATVSTPGDINPDNNSDDDPTTVTAPDLAVVKSHVGNFVVGQNGVYTITVTNVGDAPTTGTITVTDTLPTGLIFVSGVGPGWTCIADGQVVTCTNPGPLNPGDSSVITLTVSVGPEAVPSITNSAMVTNPYDPDPFNNTDDDPTEVEPVADLHLIKTIDNPNPNLGDTITFTVTVTNDGPNTATGVEVTDQLPPGLTFVSATPSQGSYNNVTGVWTVETLNVGTSATLVIQAIVSTVEAITNTAEVTASDQLDPDSTPNNHDPAEDDQATVIIAGQVADLSLQKTVDNPTPGVGSTVTFTVTLSNAGPNTATNVVVQDQLPTGLSSVSYTASQGTYNNITGIWAVGNVPAGSTATLTIVALVTAPGAITNSAEVIAVDQPDPDSVPNNNDPTEDDQDDVVIEAQPADLTITKSHSGSFAVGYTGTYTLTVTNIGAGSTTGPIIVTDTLPTGLTFVSGTGPGWTCSAALQVVTCTNPGPLGPGASSTITITVSVSGAAFPNVTNSATVSTPGDGDPNNNSDDDPTDIVAPDLQITKSHAGDFTTGSNGVYTITVTNVGSGPTHGPIVVTDTLPTGLTFVSGTGPGWTCSAALQIVTCTNPGPLAPGASTTITLTVSVSREALGGVINTVTVFTPDDTNPDNNSDDDPTNVELGLGQICGFKWLDLDADGNRAENEPYLPGITITLVGVDIFGNPVTLSTVTDENGQYCFTRLVPGTYLICEAPPEEIPYFETFPVSGPVCPNGTIGWLITLGDGQNLNRIKFGNVMDEPTLVPLSVATIQAVATPQAVYFRAIGQGIKEISVELFDLSGRAIYRSDWQKNNLVWAYQNERAERVAPGVYLYFMSVRGYDETVIKTELRKLVVSPKPSVIDQLLATAAPKIMVLAQREGIQFKLLGQGTREFSVQVFDLSGRPVYTSDWTSTSLVWTLQNTKGQHVAKGVYLYVVAVRDSKGEITRTKLQKLIVK